MLTKKKQNSNASLSVAYLFFIIYLKSIEWTIHKIGKLKWVCMEDSSDCKIGNFQTEGNVCYYAS